MTIQMNVLLPVIAGLLGVIIGGVVSEYRSIKALRRDRRRTINRVLFHQLDIWYALRASDTSSMIPMMARSLAKHLNVAVPEAALSTAIRQQPGVQEILMKAASSIVDASLEERYKAAVDALAPVEPLLAFRLSGKSALLRYRNQVEEWIEALARSQAPDEYQQQHELRSAVGEAVNGQIYERAVEALEDDIVDVAKHLGWLTHLRVARKLRQIRDRADSDREEQFGEYFRRIDPLLRASIGANGPPS